MKDTNKG